MGQMPSTDLKVDCSYCPIRHRAVCARCEPDELAMLNDIKYYRSVPAGQVVAMRGDAVDYVASVVSGVATLTQSIDDGRTQVVGLVLPSDFIGRPGRADLKHDVTAATDLTLCCFRRKEFETLVAELPHIRDRLFEMVFDELDAAREWMMLLGRKTAREKIASFLLLIARRSMLPEDDGSNGVRIKLPVSREAMANYLGLTIETVSRQLTALRKEGIIDLDGSRTVIVPDTSALEEQAGEID